MAGGLERYSRGLEGSGWVRQGVNHRDTKAQRRSEDPCVFRSSCAARTGEIQPRARGPREGWRDTAEWPEGSSGRYSGASITETRRPEDAQRIQIQSSCAARTERSSRVARGQRPIQRGVNHRDTKAQRRSENPSGRRAPRGLERSSRGLRAAGCVPPRTSITDTKAQRHSKDPCVFKSSRAARAGETAEGPRAAAAYGKASITETTNAQRRSMGLTRSRGHRRKGGYDVSAARQQRPAIRGSSMATSKRRRSAWCRGWHIGGRGGARPRSHRVKVATPGGTGPRGAHRRSHRPDHCRARRNRNRELRRERDIPRKPPPSGASGAWVPGLRRQGRSNRSRSGCGALLVPPSGSCAAQPRAGSAHALRHRRLRVLIRVSHEASRRAYGSPQVIEESVRKHSC